jgi:hypothetical protein
VEAGACVGLAGTPDNIAAAEGVAVVPAACIRLGYTGGTSAGAIRDAGSRPRSAAAAASTNASDSSWIAFNSGTFAHAGDACITTN